MNCQKFKFGNLFRLWLKLIWSEIKFTECLLRLFKFFENCFRLFMKIRTLKCIYFNENKINIKLLTYSN